MTNYKKKYDNIYYKKRFNKINYLYLIRKLNMLTIRYSWGNLLNNKEIMYPRDHSSRAGIKEYHNRAPLSGGFAARVSLPLFLFADFRPGGESIPRKAAKSHFTFLWFDIPIQYTSYRTLECPTGTFHLMYTLCLVIGNWNFPPSDGLNPILLGSGIAYKLTLSFQKFKCLSLHINRHMKIRQT